MTAPAIPPALFDFLRELKENNDRAWFEANRERYIGQVRDPMLDFIAAFGEPLAEISPHFRADPRANGGSLFRIYRDTRFSRPMSARISATRPAGTRMRPASTCIWSPAAASRAAASGAPAARRWAPSARP